MSSKTITNCDDVLERLGKLKNLPNLIEMADFLDMNTSTLRNRKSRNSIPYENIISKLSAEELGFVFKNTKRDDINKEYPIYKEESRAQEKVAEEDPYYSRHPEDEPKPSEIWPDEPALRAYEQKIDEIVNGIEHGPFSQGLKVRLFDSLLRMVGQELDELRTQSDPSPPADD